MRVILIKTGVRNMIYNLDNFKTKFEETITKSKNIFIIGHKNPDFDSIGSAIGIFKLCKILGKKSTIIVNEDDLSLQPGVKLLMDSVKQNIPFITVNDYKERLIKSLNKSFNDVFDETTEEDQDFLLHNVKVKKRMCKCVNELMC